LLIGVSRDRDDKALFSGKVESQLACHLASVHQRHGDVQQHDIGVLGSGHFQARGAIVRIAGSVSPAIDLSDEPIGRVRLFIDNQDSEHSPTG
jgi:hypothetical protein